MSPPGLPIDQDDVIILKKGTMIFRGIDFNPLAGDDFEYTDGPNKGKPRQTRRYIHKIEKGEFVRFNEFTRQRSKQVHIFTYPYPYASFGVNSFWSRFRYHIIYILNRDLRILRYIKPSDKHRGTLRSMIESNTTPGDPSLGVDALSRMCQGKFCHSYDPVFTKYALMKSGIDGVMTIAGMDAYSHGFPAKAAINSQSSMTKVLMGNNSSLQKRGVAELILFENDLQYCFADQNSGKVKCNYGKISAHAIWVAHLGDKLTVDINNKESTVQGEWDLGIKRYISRNGSSDNVLQLRMIEAYKDLFNPWFQKMIKRFWLHYQKILNG